jgi:hypothetical protein
LFYRGRLSEQVFVVKGARRKRWEEFLFGAEPVDEVAELAGDPVDPFPVGEEKDSDEKDGETQFGQRTPPAFAVPRGDPQRGGEIRPMPG